MWVIIWIIVDLVLVVLSRFEANLNYTIQENHPSGIQIGYISLDVMHPDINLPKMFDSSYVFMLRDNSEYFHLDSKTGVLKTALKINLEVLCPKSCNDEGIGFLYLVVNVWKDSQLHGVINVKIVVLDQNDNVPVFPVKVFEKKVKEILYGIGKIIELPKAVDKDVSEINSRVLYQLNRQSDTFQLQVTNDSNPRLVLTKDMDFETKNLYELTLLAWNPAQPDLKSYLEIRIHVIDINDCEPKFSKSIFELMLDENTKIGKLIAKLEATDRDRDSKLTYGMGPSSKQANKDTFNVKDTGEVILIKKLDVEIQRTYEIPVFVTDGEFATNSKIRVFVRDVNDHPPSYNLNPAIISIEENQPANILVGQAIIKDVDASDVNGDIRCKEPPGKSNLQDLKFSPDPAEYPLSLKYDMYSRIPLDREEAQVRMIYLICHDEGLHERLTSTMVVNLQVIDVNDNPPIFSKSIYKAQIRENNNIGDSLIQVTAQDKDDKENAVILYSIMDGPWREIFFINQNTGWIKVMRELDREEKDKYRITINALNKSPKVTFNTTVVVEIEVIDENDNRPKLMPPNRFEISENIKPYTFIGNLISEDKDSGKNGEITFSLINTKMMEVFDLKKNGSIFSKVSFDREIQDQYCLSIRVNDLGVPISQSVSGTICILILDINDNTPIISIMNTQTESDTEGAKNISQILNNDIIIASIHEKIGQKIATIMAHDADKGDNGKVKFSLGKMRDDDSPIPLFMIDEDDGSIKINRAMSRDSVGEYKITIIAQDKGDSPRSSEKVIRIQIQDIPSQNYNYPRQSGNVSGNVLIVIILSTISAFLTALLIGAILCMVHPCCQTSSSQNDYQVDSNMSNTQTLLQKLPPHYNINSYGPFESSYESNWNLSLNRNERLCNNVKLDFLKNNLLDKTDYTGTYTPQNTLCQADHMMSKLHSCSCGGGPCVRYSNFLSPNPEEQCSDSGRGASDDDIKALNMNGNSAILSRLGSSIYGTYSMGDSRSSRPSDLSSPNINDQVMEYRLMQMNQSFTEFKSPYCKVQVSQIPLRTFPKSVNSKSHMKSSNFEDNMFHLGKPSSIESFSNLHFSPSGMIDNNMSPSTESGRNL